MWIDSGRCDQTFHVLGKDDQDKWIVIHSDGSECKAVEFGGEVDERIKVAEVLEKLEGNAEVKKLVA